MGYPQISQMSADRELGLGMAVLVPIRTAEQMAAAHVAAKADGSHWLISPTHLVMKRGEIAGAVSVGAMTIGTTPLVAQWFDTKRMQARDSLGIINTVENVVRAGGHTQGAMLSAKNSPFVPLLPRMGFELICELGLWLKRD